MINLVAVFAVLALFVSMLSLLCFCVIPFSLENKDLYIAISNINFYSPKKKTVEHKKHSSESLNTNKAKTAKTAIFIYKAIINIGLLGSRVISVLDSGAEGPGSNRSRDAVG